MVAGDVGTPSINTVIFAEGIITTHLSNNPGTLTLSSSQFIGYYPYDLKITNFRKTGYISQLQIEPALPEGVEFALDELIISGRINMKIPETTYTISFGNSYNTLKTISFTLSVQDCNDENKVPFYGEFFMDRAESSSNNGWSLSINGTKEIGSERGETEHNKIYTYTQCIDVGSYELTLTKQNTAWNSNSYVSITIAGLFIGKYRKTSQNVQIIPLNCNKPILIILVVFSVNPVVEWNYADTPQPTNWYQPEYSGITEKKKLSDMLSFPSNTIYMRTELTSLNETDKDTIGIDIYIKHKSGVILYVNGIQLYKKFLPT